jgi:hypothetical protein
VALVGVALLVRQGGLVQEEPCNIVAGQLRKGNAPIIVHGSFKRAVGVMIRRPAPLFVGLDRAPAGLGFTGPPMQRGC